MDDDADDKVSHRGRNVHEVAAWNEEWYVSGEGCEKENSLGKRRKRERKGQRKREREGERGRERVGFTNLLIIIQNLLGE